MSYAAQRDAFSRTLQDLIVMGVRECQNHYASLVQQLLTRTDEFDHADWTKTSVTVTPNAATDPEGNTTADSLDFNAANDAVSQRVTGTAVTSKAFTALPWLKIPAGSQTVTIRIRNLAGTEIGSKQVTVTPTWSRPAVEKLFSGTPVDDVVFEIIRLAGDTITTLYAWRANMYRNAGDQDAERAFPSVRRSAEAVGTTSVNASRCTAVDAGDGLRCYYARPHCQDPANFNPGNTYELTPALRGFREYRFCRQDAPLALPGENVLPLLSTYDTTSQEVDDKLAVTVNERVNLDFLDDAFPGLWNVVQQQRGALVNTAIGVGTFWRRFMSIYRNFVNPAGYVIRKSGFVEPGVTETDFQQRGRYIMRNASYTSSDHMKLQCADRLKLTRLQIPSKISQSNLLATSIDTSTTTVRLIDLGEVTPPAPNAASAAPDYFVVLEIDYDNDQAEKVNVLARALSTNDATVQRGRWGTTAKYHPSGAKIREVAEFGTERTAPAGVPLGKNLFDIVYELLRVGGIDAADIDTATLTTERDTWYPSSVNPTTGAESGTLFRRTVTEPTSIDTLTSEIREVSLLRISQSQDQKVIGKLLVPPLPTDTIDTLTDDANLVEDSVSIDLDDETRLTRAVIAWDLEPGLDGGSTDDYNLIQAYIALDEEGTAYYGEERLKIILSKWLRGTDLLSAGSMVARIIARFRRALRKVNAQLEIKDDAIQVGDYRLVTTSKLQGPDGSPDPRLVVVQKKETTADGVVQIEGLDTDFARQLFWTPDGLADYDSATDAEKRYGYWADDQGLVGAKKELAYHWF